MRDLELEVEIEIVIVIGLRVKACGSVIAKTKKSLRKQNRKARQ